eukprot:CAMPEP_0206235478 /NCGR_PEP_ID=MMETSP0047_2-20121206/13172_1 /ASSEMBLY_ACC=CAM_ASM_000192 /TAXON_ID=195065 /ORGANISM="Chroomonas mesostigmatica_cf, Strain CCMP1168" /LENGTH=210 /DNA_ID=CAMNT_0053659687 /DNA_START=29 /DNA_END=661 /DNA_ORIENTATION=+
MDWTEALAKLSTVDPRRRVDRSKYTDESMPEHPGATLLSHVALRGAQVGSLAGVLIFAPIQWIRGGRKEALLKTIAPRIGAMGLLGGGVLGGAMVVGMALAPPSSKPSSKPPWTDDGVDDRAFRISHNQKIIDQDNYLAGGALAGLVCGRSQAGRGIVGHVAVGMAMATLASVAVLAGVPEIRKRWPAMKKSLTDAGVDLSWLEVPTKKA